MSAQDELKKVIYRSNRLNTQIDLQDDRRLQGSQLAWAGFAAATIVRLGYRKPRTITTAEELDSLWMESVVFSPSTRTSYQNFGSSGWAAEGRFYDSSQIELPASLLFDPRPAA